LFAAFPILAVVHFYHGTASLVPWIASFVGLLSAALIPWERFEAQRLAAIGIVVPWGWVGLSTIAHTPGIPTPLATDAPPILIVLVDTLRADALGYTGNVSAETPNFDRFASKSVVYTQAQSTAPWTTPAVASLFTGLPPHQHGAGLDPGPPRRFTGLHEEIPSLVEQFQHTHRTGAILSNVFLRRFSGLDKGFDYYDDRATGHDPLLVQLWDSLVRDAMDAARYLPADQVTDRALDWYAQMKDSPSFLVVHYMDPHTPYRAPAEYHRGSAPTDPDQLAAWEYAAEVRFLDEQLGRLFEGVPSST